MRPAGSCVMFANEFMHRNVCDVVYYAAIFQTKQSINFVLHLYRGAPGQIYDDALFRPLLLTYL